MSDEAYANGWHGFDSIGERVDEGWEYHCDGMPTLAGCSETVTTTRRWEHVGGKKDGWMVCYGVDDDGTPDRDVVLTFGPTCAAIIREHERRRTERGEKNG